MVNNLKELDSTLLKATQQLWGGRETTGPLISLAYRSEDQKLIYPLGEHISTILPLSTDAGTSEDQKFYRAMASGLIDYLHSPGLLEIMDSFWFQFNHVNRQFNMGSRNPLSALLVSLMISPDFFKSHGDAPDAMTEMDMVGNYLIKKGLKEGRAPDWAYANYDFRHVKKMSDERINNQGFNALVERLREGIPHQE